MIRPCCLLPPPQPLPRIFPIEKFLRSILRFGFRLNLEGCFRALHALRRERWLGWQELEFAEAEGQKCWNFSSTPAPFSPPCPLCLLKFWISASRGRINNISKCRLWTRQGMGRWQQKRGIRWLVGAKSCILIHVHTILHIDTLTHDIDPRKHNPYCRVKITSSHTCA